MPQMQFETGWFRRSPALMRVARRRTGIVSHSAGRHPPSTVVQRLEQPSQRGSVSIYASTLFKVRARAESLMTEQWGIFALTFGLSF